MILVADSGSSKCDWILVNDERCEKMSTMGFNPFFHNSALIESKIRETDMPKYAEEIKNIYYYGAGCSSKEFNAVIENALGNVFTNAQISVDHDLTAAAYATCNGEPGIACILGTGSNSCYFDGANIHEVVPALGYILGDEGSGSYYGKKLLSKYLYGTLPKHIHKNFEDHYEIDKQTIFENVYQKPHANVYLASFMRFLSGLRDDEYVKEFIYKGFSDFIRMHIWKYENYREVPVHFVGSIAYYFEDLLRDVGKKHNLTIEKIVKQPVYELVKHHTETSISE